MLDLIPYRRGGLSDTVRDIERRMRNAWDDFPSLFEPFTDFMTEYSGFGRNEEIKETKDAYVMKVALPGLEKDKIDVNLEDRLLTIKAGDTKEEEDKGEKNGMKYLTRRMGGVQYNRQLRLGDEIDVEKIASSYRNGILEMTFPKSKDAPKKETKKIDVKYQE